MARFVLDEARESLMIDRNPETAQALLPEEDAVGDPGDDDDEQDDTLPADLWYASAPGPASAAWGQSGRICAGTYTFS